MSHLCVVKCFFRARLWTPGERISPEKGETLPKFFKPLKQAKAELEKEEKAKEVKEEKDPKTLSEAAKKETRKNVADIKQKEGKDSQAADMLK